MNIEKEFFFFSRATSLEEIGNDIYPPMKDALRRNDIPYSYHQASRITNQDYIDADEIYFMDELNKRYLDRLIIDEEKKMYPISIFTSSISEIEDPWYTSNFDKVIHQLTICVKDILNKKI